MSGQPPQERSWDELLGTDRAAPGEVADDVRHQLGLSLAPQRPAGHPDVTGLAGEIGL